MSVLKGKSDLKDDLKALVDVNKVENNSRWGRRGPAKKVKPKAIWPTIKRILSYLGPAKIAIVFIIIALIAATILNTLIPTLFSFAIDEYIVTREYDGLLRIALFMIAFAAINALVRYLSRFFMVRISQNAIAKIRSDAFDSLLDAPVSYFDEKGAGDINSRISNDVELINNAMAQSLVQFVNTLIVLVGVTVLMIRLNWALSLIVFAFMPILFGMIIFISKKSRKYFMDQQVSLASLNGIIEEDITGLEVVKLYNHEPEMIDEFARENETLKNASFKAQLYSGLLWPFIHFFNNLIYLSVVAVGGFLYLQFGVSFVSIGDISGVSQYSRQFIQPISQIGQLFNTLMQGIAGAERVFEMMDTTSEYEPDETEALAHVEGKLAFEHVDFSYVEGTPILKDITFQADPGSIIAIVGPTGGGKTTLIKLLNHFYELNGGAIKIDDVDIKHVQRDALRKRIGIVLQDTHLFKGSIYENIRYGDLDATSEEVIDAAKKCGAHDFITKLPDRYDTLVLEGGQNFSQGERQLISIARTLLNDPDLLILDEATSSIDTRTEAKIQASLNVLMKNRTSIVIAHRLQTIQNADQILVIKEGALIEQGTHDTLLLEKGFYSDLYHAQFAL